MTNFIDIYSFIFVSGCVYMGPNALLCPISYNAVKRRPCMYHITFLTSNVVEPTLVGVSSKELINWLGIVTSGDVHSIDISQGSLPLSVSLDNIMLPSFPHTFCNIINRTLYSDGYQLNPNKINKVNDYVSLQVIEKRTRSYVYEKDSGIGVNQAHKCGGVKPVYLIPTSLLIIDTQTAMQV